jgi:hypothetical protein
MAHQLARRALRRATKPAKPQIKATPADNAAAVEDQFAPGKIIVLRDGTRYLVQDNGSYRKLPPSMEAAT